MTTPSAAPRIRPIRAALSLKEHCLQLGAPIGTSVDPAWCAKIRSLRANATRMRHRGKHHPKPEPGEPRDPPDESLRRLRSRFSRRLESFGLGETQSPLLTDN